MAKAVQHSAVVYFLLKGNHPVIDQQRYKLSSDPDHAITVSPRTQSGHLAKMGQATACEELLSGVVHKKMHAHLWDRRNKRSVIVIGIFVDHRWQLGEVGVRRGW